MTHLYPDTFDGDPRIVLVQGDGSPDFYTISNLVLLNNKGLPGPDAVPQLTEFILTAESPKELLAAAINIILALDKPTLVWDDDAEKFEDSMPPAIYGLKEQQSDSQ